MKATGIMRIMRITNTTITRSRAERIVFRNIRFRLDLTRPVRLDAFEILVSVDDFWLTKVKLPQQRTGV